MNLNKKAKEITKYVPSKTNPILWKFNFKHKSSMFLNGSFNVSSYIIWEKILELRFIMFLYPLINS